MVLWDNIKDNPPEELKISPIAMIPHKSQLFQAILDLYFALRPKNGKVLPSVKKLSVKNTSQGAIYQLAHYLMKMIHEFAQADAYILPHAEGEQVRLVVQNSLQMGWIKSLPYFCAASETARYVAQQYVETIVGTLPNHKSVKHSSQIEEFEPLPETGSENLH